MSLKRNVLANFAGSAWAALMSLAFVPLYIRILGVEGYGVVGVFTSLVSVLIVLDLGLSQAMTREMARLSIGQESLRRRADTIRTLEVCYWAIAVVVGVIVASLGDFIAYRWLNPAHFDRGDLREAIWIMALVIALRWPVALYVGALNGLQNQVVVNLQMAIFATLQGAGAAITLMFLEPSVRAFFLWQIVVALVQVAVLRWLLYQSAGREAGKFDRGILREIRAFAGGVGVIGLLAMLLTQIDKVVLSRVLSLEDFGYYTFATTVAAVVFRLVGPVFTAFYPRLAQLVAQQNELELARVYHQACQLMAAAILPAGFVLAVFAPQIFWVWTGNEGLVSNASRVASVLILGNLLNGLVNIPYALQLAHGWTRLSLINNGIFVVFLAPAAYLAASRWGMLGAALVWLLLNLGYFVFNIQIMHRRLLPQHKWRWYISDSLLPAAAAALPCGIGWLFLSEMKNPASVLALIAATATSSLALALAATEPFRTWFSQKIRSA